MPQLEMTNWFTMFLTTWLSLMIMMLKTTNTTFSKKQQN